MQQHSASASVAKNIIAVHDLVFRYPNAASPCLDIAELIVQTGERIFLHGASGSGKSTLLSLLGGVLHAEHGVIRLLSHDLVAISSSQRDQLRADHMGFIFQQFNLIPYLSVIENVLLPCRFSSRRMKQALTKVAGGNLQEEAGRLLSQLDLSSTLWHTPVTQLSVGQQQRVAAARALIGSPDIVIADEPTSALDTDRQTAFIELLMRECTAANTTLLFVSHDRRLASMFHREISLPDINRADQMNTHSQ